MFLFHIYAIFANIVSIVIDININRVVCPLVEMEVSLTLPISSTCTCRPAGDKIRTPRVYSYNQFEPKHLLSLIIYSKQGYNLTPFCACLALS